MRFIMVEGPRPPASNEFNKVVEFLDKSLRPKGLWTIEQEYPTALSLSNLSNMRIIRLLGINNLQS